MVQLFLQYDSLDVNESGLYSLLYNTVCHGNYDMVRLLLARQDMDIEAGRSSPLIIATRTGRDQAVQLLLQQDGVNVNRKDPDKCTAIGYAIQCERRKDSCYLTHEFTSMLNLKSPFTVVDTQSQHSPMRALDVAALLLSRCSWRDQRSSEGFPTCRIIMDRRLSLERCTAKA